MSVRVRFAPSPTGALHIGGVRTALYNYLFAKKQGGSFILRIEDTDQSRFVEGAEEYIRKSLEWAGISPDEGVAEGGEYGPYKQSERKEIYAKYAQKLVEEGNAYYAFDTSEELEAMRERLKENRVANPQYNAVTRMQMKNALTMEEAEVKALIEAGTPYVIRYKMPKNEDIRFQDIVRGWVVVNSTTLDDKILMKSDGMPTYHLANIVDDHLMKITHVIRGEEWLPSAPLHVMLYESLGWGQPQFAHLPLLLKPDGNGKLSKRAADKLGFPIFPLNWNDPENGELSVGYKEAGYLPDAFINFLALLGWNPGGEQEIFSMEELISAFSLERINKAGAKFDIEKAKWFNQQYLKDMSADELAEKFAALYDEPLAPEKTKAVSAVLRDRVTFIKEMKEMGAFFFEKPTEYDEKTVKKKWKPEIAQVLITFSEALLQSNANTAEDIKALLVGELEKLETPLGRVMPALRLALSGKAGGPDLMEIMAILGKEEVADRIKIAVETLKND